MTFEQLHPDIVELDCYNQLKRWAYTGKDDYPLEVWEREDANHPWIDVTPRERAAWQLQKELKQLEREMRKVQEVEDEQDEQA